MNLLDKIVETKQQELAQAKSSYPLAELKRQCVDLAPVRSFVAPFSNTSQQNISIIAELKQASPSVGMIRSSFNPAEIAESYQAGGATALSVLTDRTYFKGDLAHVAAVSRVALPVLRKDFTIDVYQIYETRAARADALLLIAAILSDAQLADYLALANEIGLDVLVEIHDEVELARALSLKGRFLLGINNRDLKTFAVSLETSKRLAALVPQGYAHPLISESGLRTRGELLDLRARGFGGFLIGEQLLRSADVKIALRQLLQG